MGAQLTIWSARFAVAVYFAATALRLLIPRVRRVSDSSVLPLAAQDFKVSFARFLWSAGCVTLWLHVGCAFHFHHGWSHAAAVEDTARQTREAVGIDFGGGVYFNYVMLLVWSADAAWWWASPRTYLAQGIAWEFAIHGFLLFMVVNAAIVFAAGPLRWVTVGACAALLVIVISQVARERRTAESPSPNSSID